jgi:hypothetical protein
MHGGLLLLEKGSLGMLILAHVTPSQETNLMASEQPTMSVIESLK